jgi:myosin-5
LFFGNTSEIDGVDDLREFGVTRDAFRLAGFSGDDVGDVFTVLAAILHLGNIKITAGNILQLTFY